MNSFLPLRRPVGLAGLLLLGSLGLGAQAPAAKAPAATDPVVISVGNQQIRASEFMAIIKASPAADQASMLANKRSVADQLSQLLALAQLGQTQGLDQNTDFKAQMLMARSNALAEAMVNKLQAAATPTDAQIQAYYNAHLDAFAQAKVRHILISDNETQGGPSNRTPAQALAKAQQIEAQLKGGADFATLAKSDSDDTGSKAQGGELGEVLPGQTVPEFEAAVQKLPIGQISEPVHTQYGYHIIEVESRGTLPLAQAKADITQELTNEAIQNRVDQVTAAAHVTINDSYFGPEPAPTPAPAKAPAAK